MRNPLIRLSSVTGSITWGHKIRPRLQIPSSRIKIVSVQSKETLRGRAEYCGGTHSLSKFPALISSCRFRKFPKWSEVFTLEYAGKLGDAFHCVPIFFRLKNVLLNLHLGPWPQAQVAAQGGRLLQDLVIWVHVGHVRININRISVDISLNPWILSEHLGECSVSLDCFSPFFWFPFLTWHVFFVFQWSWRFLGCANFPESARRRGVQHSGIDIWKVERKVELFAAFRQNWCPTLREVIFQVIEDETVSTGGKLGTA